MGTATSGSSKDPYKTLVELWTKKSDLHLELVRVIELIKVNEAKLHEKIRKGESKNQIRDYCIARYGADELAQEALIQLVEFYDGENRGKTVLLAQAWFNPLTHHGSIDSHYSHVDHGAVQTVKLSMGVNAGAVFPTYGTRGSTLTFCTKGPAKNWTDEFTETISTTKGGIILDESMNPTVIRMGKQALEVFEPKKPVTGTQTCCYLLIGEQSIKEWTKQHHYSRKGVEVLLQQFS